MIPAAPEVAGTRLLSARSARARWVPPTRSIHCPQTPRAPRLGTAAFGNGLSGSFL